MPSLQRLVLIVFAALIGACSPSEKVVFGEAETIDAPSAGTVTGPRLTNGPDDELILSWMESGEAGTSLKYSRLDGDRFGAASTVVVEPRMFVNWADLPSVMRVAGHHWVAHWLRYSADATYSYDVVLSQSFDNGATWSTPLVTHTDGTPTEHGFVSMHREDDGIALLWLDGRETAGKPQDDVLATSMTLRSAVISTNGTRLHEQLVDDSVCDCCQTDVAVGSEGPVAVYRNRTAEEVRDINVTRHVDGAWETGIGLHADDWVIPGCPVNGPSIVADGDDVAVAWFTAANDQPRVQLARSQDGGRTFGKPVEIASGRLAGYVGIAFLDSASVAISWVSRNGSGENTINIRSAQVNGDLSPALEVATTQQLRLFPQLAYRDHDLLIIWTDEREDLRELHIAKVPISAG